MAINVLVAIGGTGSRVAEAYVYAASAGLLNNNTKTLVFVVDKDIDCGNTTRLIKTIDEYREMRECTGLPLPEIERCEWCVEDAMQQLNPNVAKGGHVSFADVARNPGTNDALLVDLMHSREEQDFDLQKGFYGHPSLGAALYGLLTETPVFQSAANTLVNQIRTELASASGEVRTYFVGSMFGGTGASLLPNVARTLHEDPKIGQNPNYRQAACLMLPYFKFQAPTNQQGAPVNFATFDEKTATALDFYAKDPTLVSTDYKPRNNPAHAPAVFDEVYLFGRKPLEPTCPAYTLGGKDQVHTFTVVDLFAALGGVEFFNGTTVQVPQGMPHLYSADMPTPCVNWPQVPNADAQPRFEQMMRFCYAFLNVLYPMFAQPRRELARLQFLKNIYGADGLLGGGPARLPQDLDFGKEVQRIAPFCEKFMRFFADLHRCNTTVAPGSVDLFTSVLELAHMYLLDPMDQLQPLSWFCENYIRLRRDFKPDNILVGQRATAVPDGASLHGALSKYRFDLNAHPGLTGIYRAVYEIMQVKVR